MAMVIHVTRNNIDWAVERTGKTREEVIKRLEAAEEAEIVCTMLVKPYQPPADGDYIYDDFPRKKGSW